MEPKDILNNLLSEIKAAPYADCLTVIFQFRLLPNIFTNNSWKRCVPRLHCLCNRIHPFVTSYLPEIPLSHLRNRQQTLNIPVFSYQDFQFRHQIPKNLYRSSLSYESFCSIRSPKNISCMLHSPLTCSSTFWNSSSLSLTTSASASSSTSSRIVSALFCRACSLLILFFLLL